MRRIVILFALFTCGCSATQTVTIISTPEPTVMSTSTPKPTADYRDFEDFEGLVYGILNVGYTCVEYLTYSETADNVMESCLECKDFYEDMQTFLDDLNVPIEERAMKEELREGVDIFLRSFDSCLAGDGEDMEKYLTSALSKVDALYKQLLNPEMNSGAV